MVEDALNVTYIRRELIDESGTVTISYENFDGSSATPTAPIKIASVVLPVGASTSAKQDDLRGVQGTGSTYDPPTGGSGVFGWLSGTYKEIVSGIKLKLGGSDVSSSNPLPVVTYSNPKTSAIEASLIGKVFKAWVTAPATAAKYSAVQIWNPVGSGVNLVLPQIGGYNSSGTMKWYPILNQVQLTGTAGFIQKMNPTGGASFQILTEALNARTATDSFGITVSSTTPNGTGLQISNEFYTIPEGWGLRYEGETVNIAMNFIVMVLESANT